MSKKINVRNRALAQDRPNEGIKCKKVDISDKKHCCHPNNGGHEHRFYIFDRYGVCIKCNDEVLT